MACLSQCQVVRIVMALIMTSHIQLLQSAVKCFEDTILEEYKKVKEEKGE